MVDGVRETCDDGLHRAEVQICEGEHEKADTGEATRHVSHVIQRVLQSTKLLRVLVMCVADQ